MVTANHVECTPFSMKCDMYKSKSISLGVILGSDTYTCDYLRTVGTFSSRS